MSFNVSDCAFSSSAAEAPSSALAAVFGAANQHVLPGLNLLLKGDLHLTRRVLAL
jgi:hypothetical protein